MQPNEVKACVNALIYVFYQVNKGDNSTYEIWVCCVISENKRSAKPTLNISIL